MSIMQTHFPIAQDSNGGIIVLLLGRATQVVGDTVTVRRDAERFDNFIVADLKVFKLSEAPEIVLDILNIADHEDLQYYAQRAYGTGLSRSIPMTLVKLAAPLNYQAYREGLLRQYAELSVSSRAQFIDVELAPVNPVPSGGDSE